MRRNPARHVVSAIALIGAILHASPNQAQVNTAITSSGLGTTVAPPPVGGTNYQITGGTRRGTNLFHSFGAFSVGEGDTASFRNTTPAVTTSNIVSRVTGEEQSNIFGTIDTLSYPGANLFLINPRGVVFGPSARLDVGGSFHASTADYVRFADGAKLYADLARNSVLTVARPEAFGFLGAAPAQIRVEGSKLSVQSGQTLSLIGGEVAITGATLAAPGGRVQIASLSSGEVMLDGNVTPSSRLGPIKITNALIGVTEVNQDLGGIGLGSGTVIIRGGQLLVDASTIVAHTWEDVAGPRLIDIQVAGDVCLTNGAKIQSTTFLADRGGDVTITADRLRLKNQSLLETNAFAEGDGGDVIATVGRLAVVGGSNIRSTTTATGHGGNITVKADKITISGRDSADNPSQIFSDAQADGNGGNVSILPRVSTLDLVLNDVGTIGSDTLFGAGRGGDVKVNATNVSLLGGATISSLTSTPSARGGSIALTANSVTISGGDELSGARSGIRSGSFGAEQTGSPGKISVTATNFTLTQGGVIESGGLFAPEAGDIEIAATNSLVISSGGSISSQAFARPGGQVSLGSSTAIAIMDGGFVNTSTIGAGSAGSVVIHVRTLTMSNGAEVASSSNAPDSGPGGDINVQAGLVQLASGATISASSSGTGLAGSVTIQAATFQLQDSFITTAATVADGGDIDIQAGSLVFLTGSKITTSVGSGEGKGGNIAIDPQFVVLNNSQIRADAFGGPGGNITIVSDVFLSSGSTVSASSALSAPGTINVTARITDLSGSLVQLPENVLQAATLLRAACSARVAEGKASSLVVAGREGVPPEPEGLLWSPLDAMLTDLSVTAGEAHESELLPQFAGVWLGSNCAR